MFSSQSLTLSQQPKPEPNQQQRQQERDQQWPAAACIRCDKYHKGVVTNITAGRRNETRVEGTKRRRPVSPETTQWCLTDIRATFSTGSAKQRTYQRRDFGRFTRRTYGGWDITNAPTDFHHLCICRCCRRRSSAARAQCDG